MRIKMYMLLLLFLLLICFVPVVNAAIQLKTSATSTDDDRQEKCTICLCSFEDDERVRYVFHVCHKFHHSSVVHGPFYASSQYVWPGSIVVRALDLEILHFSC